MLGLLAIACAPAPVEPTVEEVSDPVLPALAHGPLSGWNIVISPGHGKLLHRYRDNVTIWGWAIQRKESHGLTEDHWTLDFVDTHLAPALEAQGATVFSLRERDPSPTRWTGPPDASSIGSSMDRTGHRIPDYPAGTTVFSPGRSGRAYLRWAADTGRDETVHVLLDGRRVDVDQTRTGGIWWPLGRLESGPIEIRSDAPLSAEVRVGGGSFHADFPMVDVDETLPFREVAALHSLDVLGGPEHLLHLDEHRFVSDPRFRPLWAGWAFEGVGEHTLFLSIHTNAGRGRGTTVFVGVDDDVRPALEARPRSRALCESIARELQTSLSPLDDRWIFRGVKEGDFSEVSPAWNPLDGALIELGFHDSAWQVERLLDPAFLEAAAVGISNGIRASVSTEPTTPD